MAKIHQNRIPDSPTDSGYGSSESTPEKYEGNFESTFTLDGADSDSNDDDSFSTVDSANAGTDDQLDKFWTQGNTLVPERTCHSKTFQLNLVVPKPCQKKKPTTPIRVGRNVLSFPDRFIPDRDYGAPHCEKLRTAKSLVSMSATERMMRDSFNGPDPFSDQQRRFIPMASTLRPPLRRLDPCTLRPKNIGLI
jgi:hypothetical protein